MCTRSVLRHRVTRVRTRVPFPLPTLRLELVNSAPLETGGGEGGRDAKFGTGEKPRNDTFHYLMRGTWLGARQLSRSCVFHLDNYLESLEGVPCRLRRAKKRSGQRVNGIQHGRCKNQRDYGLDIFIYIYIGYRNGGRKKIFTVINY